MLLDLSRLRGTDHIDRTFEPGQLAAPGDPFRILTPATLVADVRKDGRKVTMTGRVTATLEVECGRCLDPFNVPISAPLDLTFLPIEDALTPPPATAKDDDDLEVKADEVAVSYYQNEVIDLGEVIREQCFLALPMKPLCRQDCLGLCPVCGGNRNQVACQCEQTWEDPRLAPLKKLLGNSTET